MISLPHISMGAEKMLISFDNFLGGKNSYKSYSM